jgi:predicted dehydrogenase
MENKENNHIEKNGSKKNLHRRDVLKGLATIPVLGAFAYGAIKKWKHDRLVKHNIWDELGLSSESEVPVLHTASSGEKIRLGIIGYGIRGEQLLRAAGYAQPQVIDEWKEGAAKNSNNRRYTNFLEQGDLNVEITGICDIFDVHAKRALAASANKVKEGSSDGKPGKPAKRYKTYKELLAADDIDAVIIATPDHWHAQMTIEAARLGKHVYVEKGMTRTVEEAFLMKKAVEESGIIFQLGHQGRQTNSYNKAREIFEKDVLGKISIIEVCTNRNDPNGAWVYDLHPEASPETIDWEQFVYPTNWHPFSRERFFRWRCWWDYGTGLSGDLFTHEFDAINQVFQLGIPVSAVASGGIYFYKDGRDVPDVFQAVFEYPQRDISLLYSASLSSDRFRGKVIMGHDAHMEMEDRLIIYPDRNSTRYKDKIQEGIIDPDKPMITYFPGMKNVDAVTSATEQYFASRGLLYTHINGRRVDTTHLHVKEWLDCIRVKKQPSCDIEQGFQEAITAHMATIAYREKRKVHWDAINQKII